MKRPPRGRAPRRLQHYESGGASMRRAKAPPSSANESAYQLGTLLSVIEAGRPRGAASIYFIDVQVALNDFAVLGRKDNLPDVRHRVRLVEFSRPETHLPHRRGPAVLQLELRGFEGELREQRLRRGDSDGTV